VRRLQLQLSKNIKTKKGTSKQGKVDPALSYNGTKTATRKPLSDVLSSTVVLYGTLLSQFTKTLPLNGYREFA